jgi:hypothetical protein
MHADAVAARAVGRSAPSGLLDCVARAASVLQTLALHDEHAAAIAGGVAQPVPTLLHLVEAITLSGIVDHGAVCSSMMQSVTGALANLARHAVVRGGAGGGGGPGHTLTS